MNNEAIISAIKTTLDNAAGLSYVKQILLGRREPQSLTQFPIILIEPTGDVEQDDLNTTIDVRTTFIVYGALNIVNADKQLIGDANIKGAFDFEDDIKKALDADLTLGGVASNLVIKGTNHSSDNYPMREIAIEVEVWFRQTRGIRT